MEGVPTSDVHCSEQARVTQQVRKRNIEPKRKMSSAFRVALPQAWCPEGNVASVIRVRNENAGRAPSAGEDGEMEASTGDGRPVLQSTIENDSPQ